MRGRAAGACAGSVGRAGGGGEGGAVGAVGRGGAGCVWGAARGGGRGGRGPKGKWNPDRSAVRHGHENGEVTLGGRACRSGGRAPGSPMASRGAAEDVRAFAGRDQLEGVVPGADACRRVHPPVPRAQEPVGPRSRPTPARRRSRRCRGRSCTAPASVVEADEPAARRLAPGGDDARGIELHGRTNIVALGITTDGREARARAVGGVDENAAVAPRCSRTWSTAGWTSSRGCCS